ncbi:MAG: hypothetical protein H6525_08825 [Actinobacteria bacterium]|nr:hypothetical protein [Actinomycetota bacterium]
MATGILEATADKAKEAAQGAMSQGLESGTKAPEQLASQMALIAEDLMEQSKTNRELVVGLVRTEVERAVGRIGFVREEELAAVRAHVDRLESQMKDTIDRMASASASAAAEAKAGVESARTLAETTAMRKMGLEHSAPEVTDVPPKKTVVRAPAASGASDETPAKKAPAKKATAKKATTKKAPAKKATAKKATAKKTPAKKTAATKTTTKRSTTRTSAAAKEAETPSGSES